MKILLHIGQSKTGTSSIQTFLTRNRKRLIEKGVFYPSPRVRGLTLDLGSHNFLADSLLEKRRYPFLRDVEYFEQFYSDAARNNAELMILSAEHFFGGEPRVWAHDLNEYKELYIRKLERLRSLLTGQKVEVLIYLRPQVDWLASSITQTITYGRIASKDRVFKSDRDHFNLAMPLLKYSDRLAWWDDIIRPENMIVIPYVRNQLKNKSSVCDFLCRAGIDGAVNADVPKDMEINKTLSREFIEVKRRLNQEVRTNTEEHVVVRCLQKLSRTSEKGGGYRIDDAVVSDLERFVKEDNRLLSERYLSGGEVFSAVGSYSADRYGPLEESEVAEAMRQFETAYKSISSRVLALDIRGRAWLRRNAGLAHGLLHQARRLRRWIAYGGG